MLNLYEVVAGLCKERNITAYRMCKDLGIQPSVMTDLKYGRKKSVHVETAEKIAAYFGVSVSHLLGKEDKALDTELTSYLEELKNREEMRMLFSLAKGASKEDVEKAVKIIQALKNT